MIIHKHTYVLKNQIKSEFLSIIVRIMQRGLSRNKKYLAGKKVA